MMYAALDRDVLARGLPFWTGETVQEDTQDPNHPHRTEFGNLAVHAAGFLNKNLTYHIQQWLRQNDGPGGLDTAWISYDRIFGPGTHLALGKQPPPGPSFFSQWSDFSPLAVPSITVGQHAQGLQSNRWGAKLGYAGTNANADIGWFGSQADLNGATDFSAANDKSVQWHAAYAPVDRPVQIGAYGNFGTTPLAEGGIDRYAATGLYAQLDPTSHAPGALLLMQRGWDGNSGNGVPAASRGYTAAIFFHPLRRWESLVNVRHEVTLDGLGGVAHTTSINLSSRIARYVHASVEAAVATGGKPAYRYYVWWTTPLRSQTSAPPQTRSAAGAAQAAYGAPGPATPQSAAHAAPAQLVVRTKNFAYVPATIEVRVGQSVRFVNDDDVAHTVTASDKSFDSGNMDKSATWSFTFSKPGTYAYICTYHPYMKGGVVVR